MILLKDIIKNWSQEERNKLMAVCEKLYKGIDNPKYKNELEQLIEKNIKSFSEFGLNHKAVFKTMTNQVD